MDLSKVKDFKNVFQKLSFLKNYTKLLIPLTIALAGVIFLIVSPMLAGGLKDRIENESLGAAQQLERLRRDPVPSEQWRVEREYQIAYETDVNKINNLAIQTTQRELINYDIFPQPRRESMMLFRQEFGRQYHACLNKLSEQLNGRDCPSEAEIQQRVQSSSGRITGNTRTSISTPEENEETVISEVISRERAQSSSVYLSVNRLPGYFFWQEYEYESLESALADCWYSQLAYWVIEDIASTVGSMNSNSRSVFENPVKRIINIEFEPDSDSSGTRRSTDRVGEENPIPGYVISKQDWLTNSVTERISDETLDILHFKLSVVVDSREVLEFMNTLCSGKEHEFRGYNGTGPVENFVHNQITILENKAVSFERKHEEHLWYRYGKAPVVRLDLICEYQFYKAGYEEIKPEVVKQALSVEEPDTF